MQRPSVWGMLPEATRANTGILKIELEGRSRGLRAGSFDFRNKPNDLGRVSYSDCSPKMELSSTLEWSEERFVLRCGRQGFRLLAVG
jgi:hypothetical protein